MQELLGGAGQCQLLGRTAEGFPCFQNFFLRGLVGKAHKDSAHMPVGHRHAQALCGKARTIGADNLVALDVTPQLQRLLLALFFLAADVGDDVIQNIGEGFKGLARAGNCLIGADQHVGDIILAQRVQGGYIALQAAVGLYGNKAALGAKTLALGGDDVDVVGVDLRHDHRHIGGKAVGAVVGNHGAFCLGVGFLQRFDLLFFHIDGAKDKVHLGGDLCHVGGVQHHQLFRLFGHGGLHQPAAAHSLLIGLAGTAGAGCHSGQAEPRVVFQQGYKTLPYHTGCADDTYIVLFHCSFTYLSHPTLCKNNGFATKFA